MNVNNGTEAALAAPAGAGGATFGLGLAPPYFYWFARPLSPAPPFSGKQEWDVGGSRCAISPPRRMRQKPNPQHHRGNEVIVGHCGVKITATGIADDQTCRIYMLLKPNGYAFNSNHMCVFVPRFLNIFPLLPNIFLYPKLTCPPHPYKSSLKLNTPTLRAAPMPRSSLESTFPALNAGNPL